MEKILNRKELIEYSVDKKYKIISWKLIFNNIEDEKADLKISVNIKIFNFNLEIKIDICFWIDFIDIDNFYIDWLEEIIKKSILLEIKDYRKYKIKLRKQYIDLYKNFLWRWNINSKLWFIWNEEQLEEKQTPEDKIIKDKIDCKFKKDFFWKKILEDYWPYKFINNILWDENTKDDFFISEFYFLPSLSGDLLYKTYKWIKPDMIKWKYFSRCSYYINNNLIDLLDNRLDTLFKKITKKSNKIIIFYWCDYEKVIRIVKRFWNFITIDNSDNLKINNYKWNILIISEFFNTNITSNDINLIKSIIYK